MISTRLHGLIDYGVASLFAGLAASRALSAPARRTLAMTGVYHASYSVVTDYEAGLRPWLTMRQHLVLDALGGAALCATGLLGRRHSWGERALFIGAGVSELTVVALSHTTPASGPG